jgi:hypothetical protein
LKGTSNIQHPTSNIEHRTSNIEHRTSNIEHRTSNVEHPMSDKGEVRVKNLWPHAAGQRKRPKQLQSSFPWFPSVEISGKRL